LGEGEIEGKERKGRRRRRGIGRRKKRGEGRGRGIERRKKRGRGRGRETNKRVLSAAGNHLGILHLRWFADKFRKAHD